MPSRSLRGALRRVSLSLALSAIVAAPLHAQTSFSQAFSFPAGPSVPVSYLSFQVTAGGTFDFFTNSHAAPIEADPYLYLFAGTPDALGATLGYDDDSCDNFASICTGSSNVWDAFVQRDLSAGWYTMAVSRFSFSEAEARDGYADVSAGFDATLFVNSQNGVATNFAVSGPVSTVPEPSTYALHASGLAGIAAIARRRRTA